MEKKPKLVAIVGPTATGKSDLAIKIARKFKGEIISADSRQVYRGMDIGSGKVTKKEQKLVPHYLIDIQNPKKQFTVSDFKILGKKKIKEIMTKGKIPVIAGGTGFYIDALLRNMNLPEVPPNKKLRAELEKQSAEQLFKRLKKLDPERAKTIDAKNKRRLIRALEIIKATKKPVPKLKNGGENYDILWLGVNFPREVLDKRIKIRLEKRLKNGMTREIKTLIKNGVSYKKLFDFGLEYRWISQYVKDEISYSEMKEGLLRDIVKFSKRQMTWFKRNKKIVWIKNQNQAFGLVKKFIS